MLKSKEKKINSDLSASLLEEPDLLEKNVSMKLPVKLRNKMP
jgi:hypothetical protein